MVSREEPNIKNFVSDVTNSTLLVNTINTALVIRSTMGINVPQLISSQAELLEKYSSKGFISSDDDITFKSAYYLLGFTPLWVCRASGDRVTSGLTNNGDIIFKDADEVYNINSKLVIEDSSNGRFNLYVTTALNNVYYCGTAPNVEGNKVKLSDDKLTSEEFISLLVANSIESIVYQKTEDEYKFITLPSEKITGNSDNYLQATVTNSNYVTIKLQPNKVVTNNEYVILNNTLYYFDDGQSLPAFSDTQAVINKFDLRFPTNSLLTDIYITYLEQELLTKSVGYSSLIKFKLNIPNDVDVIISPELNNALELKNGYIQSKTGVAEAGYIILTREGISNLFYIGETSPDVSSTGLTINGFFQFPNITTLNRIVMGIYENAVLKDSASDTFDYTGITIDVTLLQILSPSNSVIYETNILPETGLISSEVFSVVGLSKDDYNIENKTISNYYITIDKNVYYIGNKPSVSTIDSPSYIKVSSSSIPFKNLINSFLKYIDIDYPAYLDKSKNINILSNKDIVVSYDDTVDISVVKNQSLLNTNSKLAVFSRYTSDTDTINYSIRTTVDPEIFNLTVNVKSKTFSYDISFNPDKLDGFGSNLYYTRVNDNNPYIEIRELNPSANIVNYDSELFGGEVTSLELLVDDYITALTKLGELEGVKFDITLPGGFANIQYVKALVNFGSDIDNYTKVIITMPEYKNLDLMVAYKGDLGVNNWQAQLLCQWFKTTINNFTVTLPAELLYIERLISNFLGGNQFSPVFGKTTGLVNSNPTISFNKKEREELLGNRIIPIRHDKQNNISYFVDNLNLINLESYLGNNENFVRVVNKIAHTTDFLLEDYIARANSGSTRREVVTRLGSAFTELGLYSNEFINGIKVVCDDSNNPQPIIDQNKLVVDIQVAFNNNIKYITVYQKVVTTIV